MNATTQQFSSSYKDEIDLFELIENLWNERILIAACVAISMVFGGIYSIFATEKWTAEARFSLPSLSAIHQLNPPESDAISRSIADPGGLKSIESRPLPIPSVSQEQMLSEFVRELGSVQTLLDFDAAEGEELFSLSNESNRDERVSLATGFLDNKMTLTKPNKKSAYHAIALTLENPERAERVLKDYLEFVNSRVIENRTRELEVSIDRVIRANELLIDQYRFESESRLEEQLANLKEALQIARAAEIRNNQYGTFLGREDSRITESSDIYLRGEKLLMAEIEVLESRLQNSESNSVSAIRNLQAQNEALKSVRINASNVFVYTIEKPVSRPMVRDAPRTSLILALAMVLGGVIGVFVVLVRQAIWARKQKMIEPVSG